MSNISCVSRRDFKREQEPRCSVDAQQRLMVKSKFYETHCSDGRRRMPTLNFVNFIETEYMNKNLT